MGQSSHDNLIYPIHRYRGWQKQAACQGDNTNNYIPTKTGTKDTKHYNRTKCETCPVQKQCLDYALANRIKYGLWGNTTPKERETLYPLYMGQREYDLDLDKILFPQGQPPKPPDTIICDPLPAPNPTSLEWTIIYYQQSLFAHTYPEYQMPYKKKRKQQ